MPKDMVNQYGHPLGGCLFGTMVAGRPAYSQRCACANCGMWRNYRAGVARAKAKARMHKAIQRRAAAKATTDLDETIQRRRTPVPEYARQAIVEAVQRGRADAMRPLTFRAFRDTQTPIDGGRRLEEKKNTQVDFPQDCDHKALVKAAEKRDLTATEGGNHTTVKDKEGRVVTQIPRSVKANGTCRAIIRIIKQAMGRLTESSHLSRGVIRDKHGKKYIVKWSPTTDANGNATGYSDRYIVYDAGKPVAWAEMNTKLTSVSGVSVIFSYHRLGIATALYEYIENDLSIELKPNPIQTTEGKKFWAAYRRRRQARLTESSYVDVRGDRASAARSAAADRAAADKDVTAGLVDRATMKRTGDDWRIESLARDLRQRNDRKTAERIEKAAFLFYPLRAGLEMKLGAPRDWRAPSGVRVIAVRVGGNSFHDFVDTDSWAMALTPDSGQAKKALQAWADTYTELPQQTRFQARQFVRPGD